MSRCLDTPQAHLGIIQKPGKDAHRIAAPADASNDVAGQASVAFQDLRAGFDADHLLKFADHVRIRMRADHASDAVKRVVDAGRPLAKGLVRGVLERLRSARDRPDARAEQLHDVNVERLTLDVVRPHEHLDRNSEPRADRRRRHAVLACARLRDDAALPHAPREQPLTHRVVDLVRARVIEIFALEDEPRRTRVAAESFCFHDRRRAADEIAQRSPVLRPKLLVGEGRFHCRLKLAQGRDEHFGYKAAAKLAEVAPRVRLPHRLA